MDVKAESNTSMRILDFRLENIPLILTALLPFLLLTNRAPLFSISIFLILLVISLSQYIKNRAVTDIHFRVILILIIIFSYVLISYFLSGQPLRNLFSYGFIRYDGSIFFSYLAFFIFSTTFVDFRKALRVYFFFLFISFSIFAVIGFFEYSNSLEILTVRLDDIYVGPMFLALNNSHNSVGSVYAVVAVSGIAFILKSKLRGKIAYSGVLILCILALFITKSRGSQVAFAIGAFFVLVIGSGSLKKFLRNILILIALAVPFIFITGTYGRFMQIFYWYDLSAITRFSLWEKAITLFKQSPIMGIGFGRYNDMIWHYNILPLEGNPGVFSMYRLGNYIFNDTNAHSSYLHFLAETGVIGLLLIIFFWVFCFYFIVKGYRHTRDSFSRKVYLSVLGSIITLSALSLTEHYMTAPTVMSCISVITSLAIGLYWTENKYIHPGKGKA